MKALLALITLKSFLLKNLKKLMTNLNFYPEKPKKAYCATEIKGLL
jgi:hypothetical protein